MKDHPPRRTLAVVFIACTLSVLFFFSQRESTASAAAGTAAFSGAATVSAEASSPIAVSGSLAPAAAERTTVLPVRGSLAPKSTTRDASAERFSTQPDEAVQEIRVTGSTSP